VEEVVGRGLVEDSSFSAHACPKTPHVRTPELGCRLRDAKRTGAPIAGAPLTSCSLWLRRLPVVAHRRYPEEVRKHPLVYHLTVGPSSQTVLYSAVLPPALTFIIELTGGAINYFFLTYP